MDYCKIKINYILFIPKDRNTGTITIQSDQNKGVKSSVSNILGLLMIFWAPEGLGSFTFPALLPARLTGALIVLG